MKYITLLFIFCLTIRYHAQLDVKGVKVPYLFKTDEATLIVNGAGVRERSFIDLYVGALYLKSRTNDPNKIIQANEPMCIKLCVISHLVTSQRMIEYIDNGFRNSTNNNTAPIQDKINKLKTIFKEEIQKEDVFDIVYHTKKGSLIYKNGKLLASIAGFEFKKALFGVWLCEKADAADLRLKMIGEPN